MPPRTPVTLRHLMEEGFLRSPEMENYPVQTQTIRHLASRVLSKTGDAADEPLNDEQIQAVGFDFIDYLTSDFANVCDQAEAEAKANKRPLIEADLVRRIPDQVITEIAERMRSRIFSSPSN